LIHASSALPEQRYYGHRDLSVFGKNSEFAESILVGHGEGAQAVVNCRSYSLVPTSFIANVERRWAIAPQRGGGLSRNVIHPAATGSTVCQAPVD
jgi:hypothetical protein